MHVAYTKETNREEGDTIFDLLDLVLMELGRVLRVTQGVEGSSWVLLLLSILLHAALVLNEGNCKEFNDEDGWQSAPGNRVPQVGGLASRYCCPLLSFHPVAKAQRFRQQDPGLNKHNHIDRYVIIYTC